MKQIITKYYNLQQQKTNNGKMFSEFASVPQQCSKKSGPKNLCYFG